MFFCDNSTLQSYDIFFKKQNGCVFAVAETLQIIRSLAPNVISNVRPNRERALAAKSWRNGTYIEIELVLNFRQLPYQKSANIPKKSIAQYFGERGVMYIIWNLKTLNTNGLGKTNI